MAPGEGIELTAADLLSHAGHVAAVAAGIATASQAGEAVRPGPEAYGRLCVIVPMLLGELQDRVLDGMDAAAGSVRDTGERLRAAAEGYAEADQRSAAALGRAGSAS